MSKTTAISDIIELDPSDVSIQTDIFEEENISKTVVDLTIDLDSRVKALEMYFERHSVETVELINKISGMYMFSGTKILEQYLYRLCMKSQLPPYLKIDCAKGLCTYNEDNELGYIALDKVCQDLKDVPTPRKVEVVCTLMKCEKYKLESRNYFCIIINDQTIECDFRYKTILSLKNKNIEGVMYFTRESVLEFLNESLNMTMYRILAAQLLLVKCEVDNEVREVVEKKVLTFASDPDLDYNLRADAADTLLQISTSSDRQTLAREIIMMLGRSFGDVKTIFDNAQNVHVEEIEDSVMEALEFLSSIDMMTVNGLAITYGYVKKKIDEMLDDTYGTTDDRAPSGQEDEKWIIEHIRKMELRTNSEIALNRIYMDRALYSKYNCNLSHILKKIWTYMIGHEHEEAMRKRLLEELLDMSGLCSTGFASRLVNVISAFGDFNIRISYSDQIVANVSGRLNARARDLLKQELSEEDIKKIFYLMFYDPKDQKFLPNKKGDDDRMHQLNEVENVVEFCKEKEIDPVETIEEYQGRVLYEMTLPPSSYHERKHFLKFFRDNLLSIREEMYEEYKELITDVDFDLYFRTALMNYETGATD